MKKFASLGRGARALALALMAVALLAGCGAKGGAGKSAIALYATNSEPILDWDPSVEFSNGIIVMNNVYETLVRYDALTDKVLPLLAVEWSKAPDSLSWTFKIRPGVKFHDGSVLDAAAVKFSIDRTMKLAKGASYIWSPVKAIAAVDASTVRFDLSYPAPIDLIAACGYGSFVMSPKALEGKADNWLSQGNDAGSGPYKLRSFKEGQEVILDKFPDYWQGWKDGKKYDTVVFQKIPETATRRQMIEKGDAAITNELPYEDVASLRSNPNVSVLEAPSFQNLIYFFNTAKPALKNAKLRQALSYAYPYGDVIKFALGDEATQARGPIPAGHWGHGDGLFQYSYDLEKAKALLAQAGVKAGSLKLLLTYTSGNEAVRKATELYKSELAKVGVDLEIRAMPWSSQWEMAKNGDAAKAQDILVMYWWPDFASPYSWLFNLFHTEKDVAYNVSRYYVPAFDKAMDAANEVSGVDRAKATQMFIELQKPLIEAAPAIYAWDKKDVFVVSKSFKGFKDNPIYPNVVFFYDTTKE